MSVSVIRTRGVVVLFPMAFICFVSPGNWNLEFTEEL